MGQRRTTLSSRTALTYAKAISQPRKRKILSTFFFLKKKYVILPQHYEMGKGKQRHLLTGMF